MARTFVQDFFDLGFFPAAESSQLPLQLGKPRASHVRRIIWEVAVWLLVACGIFFRQALSVVDAGWDVSRLSAGSFSASVVISLAVFPAVMRWINKRHQDPGIQHIAAPFAFGFFLDLAALSLIRLVPHLP